MRSRHRNIPVGKNYQWSLGIQREIGAIVLEASYVANHGTGLPYPIDINQIPQSKLGLLPVQNNRPFPQYTSIGGGYFDAYSNYNSLQLSFRKRFGHGISMDTNYVWSKMMSSYDSSGWGSRNGTNTIQNSFDRKSTYARSNFDVPQNWKGSVVYALPFGKGQKFVNHGGVVDAIVGGWQLSSLFMYQSGNVFSFTAVTHYRLSLVYRAAGRTADAQRELAEFQRLKENEGAAQTGLPGHAPATGETGAARYGNREIGQIPSGPDRDRYGPATEVFLEAGFPRIEGVGYSPYTAVIQAPV